MAVRCLTQAEARHIRSMPTDPSSPTLAKAVRRAALVVDPDDNEPVVGEFERNCWLDARLLVDW